MLKNAPTLAIVAVHTEENEHCEVCPLSVYRSPRFCKIDRKYLNAAVVHHWNLHSPDRNMHLIIEKSKSGPLVSKVLGHGVRSAVAHCAFAHVLNFTTQMERFPLSNGEISAGNPQNSDGDVQRWRVPFQVLELPTRNAASLVATEWAMQAPKVNTQNF